MHLYCLMNFGIKKAVVPVLALLAIGAASVLRAAEPTAFALIKEGNRYIGEQSKDKVV